MLLLLLAALLALPAAVAAAEGSGGTVSGSFSITVGPPVPPTSIAIYIPQLSVSGLHAASMGRSPRLARPAPAATVAPAATMAPPNAPTPDMWERLDALIRSFLYR